LKESIVFGVLVVALEKQLLPEFLKDKGFYFNLRSVDLIKNTI
jgi:hypothetical protein